MSVRVSIGQSALRSTKNTPLKPSALKKTNAAPGSVFKTANSKFAPKPSAVKEEAKPAPPKEEAKPEPAPVKEEPPKVETPPKEEPKPEPPKEEPKPEPPKEEKKEEEKVPKFVEKLQNAKVSVGKTLILDCICEGYPEPDVDWFKDGKLLKNEGRFHYLYEKDDVIGLEIRKTTVEDEGEYKCVAFNKNGKVECSCEVLVDAVGEIIIGPVDSTYEENETAIFKCKYDGNPRPDVKWFLGKKQIKSGGKYTILNKNQISTLNIDDIDLEDGGYYSVVVSNDAGEDEKSVLLTVKPKAEPPKQTAPSKPTSTFSSSTAGKSFSRMPKGKKNKIPIEREGIVAENPEKYYKFDDDEIGRGKFAVVKKAVSKKDGKTYAAKIIKYDSETLKFAIREYDMMKDEKMKHPGLVQLHEAYLVQKYLILIMDYCEGKSLLDFVASKHSLTEDDVAFYIRQLCEILNHMHSNNIIHLDLRPTNIRFKNGRELQILDYNSARTVANKKAGAVVDVIGDTEFCAPEMLNFDPVLPGSDMWTVAINMYILLSGISPFYDEDEDKVIKTVQTCKWSFDEGAFETITSEAKDFIKKCLIRAPEMRLTAATALEHKYLSDEYANARKASKLTCQDTMRETDERLYSEEEEEYIEASLVFRTFEEEEYESPEESDEEEE